MTLRELMIEYILFAYDEDSLQSKYHINEEELMNLSDIDLLEIYDTTLLVELNG